MLGDELANKYVITVYDRLLCVSYLKQVHIIVGIVLLVHNRCIELTMTKRYFKFYFSKILSCLIS